MLDLHIRSTSTLGFNYIIAAHIILNLDDMDEMTAELTIFRIPNTKKTSLLVILHDVRNRIP